MRIKGLRVVLGQTRPKQRADTQPTDAAGPGGTVRTRIRIVPSGLVNLHSHVARIRAGGAP